MPAWSWYVGPEKRHVYEMKQAAEVYREADDDGGNPPPARSS